MAEPKTTKPKTAMTIARLAASANVNVETVRYYQRRGLLVEPQRREGPRLYDQATVRRLRFIRTAQTAGFMLAEIGQLLDLDATDGRARARELAENRISVLDARIAQLQAARDGLAGLAEDCAQGPAGPCPIIRAFLG